MPAEGYLYNNALLQIVKGALDIENDVVEVLLVSSSYTFNPAHTTVSQITNELVNDTGTGYERKEVAGIAATIESGDRVKVAANNVTYTAINTTANARAAVIYKKVTNDADSPLICYLQGLELATNGSDIELRMPDEGIFEILNTLPA